MKILKHSQPWQPEDSPPTVMQVLTLEKVPETTVHTTSKGIQEDGVEHGPSLVPLRSRGASDKVTPLVPQRGPNC